MKLSYIVLTLLMSLASFSQETIAGKVVDKDTKEALIGSHILNLTRVQGVSADKEGVFYIDVSINDTIMITRVGYKTLRLAVSKDLISSKGMSGEIDFYLSPKIEKLEEVEIRSHNLVGVLELDAKSFPKRVQNRVHINGLAQTYEIGKPAPVNYGSIGSAIFTPVDFLYAKFGKKPKQMKKIKELKKSKELRHLLKGRFDREYMLEYLKITDRELTDILESCNYSEFFIKRANDLQIIDAVIECYENYKALQNGDL